VNQVIVHLFIRELLRLSSFAVIFGCAISYAQTGGNQSTLKELSGKTIDVPSCYAGLKLSDDPSVTHAVVLMVDETTVVPPLMRTQAFDALDVMFRPGTYFVLVRFSTFSQQR